MSTITETITVFDTVEEAEHICNTLNTDPEDNWYYRVSMDPDGSRHAVINVFDENKIFVGKI